MKLNEWNGYSVASVDDDTLRSRVRASAARKLRQFEPAGVVYSEPALIVGGAPSVAHYLDEIWEQQRNGAVVYTTNQTHDYLIENDIVPDYFVAVSPGTPTVDWEWTGHVTPHPDVTYLLASICHDQLFDLCPREQTVVWHPVCKGVVEDELKRLGHSCAAPVPGGVSAPSRAIWLAYFGGHRVLKLYGMDSSFSDSKWAYPSTWPTLDTVEVEHNGRTFKTEPAYLLQVNGIRRIVEELRGLCSIQIFGDGLLPWVMAGHNGEEHDNASNL
jgi:hypothetical protein